MMTTLSERTGPEPPAALRGVARPRREATGVAAMRVGFVAWNFPVLSEPFVTTLAQDLIAAGIDLRVLAFDLHHPPLAAGRMHGDVDRSDLLARAAYASPELSAGASGPGTSRISALLTAFMPLRALGRVRLVLREGRFDIVHCHFASLGLAASRLRKLGLLRTRALVVHVRGHDITAFVEQNGQDIYRGLFRDADLFIANCRHFRDRAIALGCPPDKIIVIGSPLDPERFAPPAHRPPLDGRPVRLIAVGRLVGKKGFRYAIEAVHLLRQRGLAVTLDIFGDGPRRSELEQQIETLELAGLVTCHGAATHGEIAAALHGSDIALAPSVRSGSGNEDAPVNVLKEAMATGLPVVATRHGGIPELVKDGENGRLVAERAPGELADAIADLVARPQDWVAMGKAGRARVLAEYGRSQVARRTIAAYRACLEGRRAELLVSEASASDVRS